MVIPLGGSSVTGAVGFVNGAMELVAQIEAGEAPVPERIYVALGTMGTAVGLALGLRSVGYDTTVVGVQVVPGSVASMEKASELFAATNAFLRTRDRSFPELPVERMGLEIERGFYGGEYGRYTGEAVEAIRLMRREADLELDGTYTGKACAAFLKAASQRTKGDGALLFWNTRNNHPYPPEALAADYHRLPEPFWTYFEEDVQPLDRELNDRGA
jgi:D-cysteine desulfhydrase